MNKDQEECVKNIQDALNKFKDVEPLPPKMTLPFGFYDFGLAYDNKWKRLRDFESFLLKSAFGDDSNLWEVNTVKANREGDHNLLSSPSLDVEFRERAPEKPLNAPDKPQNDRRCISTRFSASRHEHFYHFDKAAVTSWDAGAVPGSSSLGGVVTSWDASAEWGEWGH